jgi:hypothetical protein
MQVMQLSYEFILMDLSKSFPRAKNGTLAAILLTRGLLLPPLGQHIQYSDGPDAIIQDSYWHRWARLLKQQTSIIVYCLLFADQ